MVSAISSGRAPARAVDDGDMVALLRDSSPVPRPPRMLAHVNTGRSIEERAGGHRGAPRLRRGATSAGGLRGAPRLGRGATSAGGLGGPPEAPQHISSVQ